MLYVLAYDLLGERPRRLGSRPLRDAEYYAAARSRAWRVRLPAAVGGSTAAEPTSSHAGAVHGGGADSYFFVPEQQRVGRLLGPGGGPAAQDQAVAGHPGHQPAAAAVRARRSTPWPWCAASRPGRTSTGVTAAAGARSRTTGSRSCSAGPRTSCDRLRQLGNDLLGVLERGDAEELSLLQSRQEGEILAMTRAIKEEQVAHRRARTSPSWPRARPRARNRRRTTSGSSTRG